MDKMVDWVKRHPGAGLVVVLILTAVLFLPALDYGFITMIDDGEYVVYNALLDWSWGNLGRIFSRTFIGLYSPLPVATYMIDYRLGELDPWSYHAQNLAWHLLGTGLVFVVMRQLKMRLFWALFFCCCYAIHPQRVESVVWVSERKDMLLAAFFWGATACHLAGGRGGRIGSAALTVAAALCKPPAIFIPVICYLLDVIRFRRWRRTRKEMLALAWPAAAALIYLIAYRSLFGGAAQQLIRDCNFRLGFYNMLRYPGKMLIPLELSPLYPDTVFTAGLIGGIAAGFGALAALCWLFWRRHRKLALDLVLPAGIGFYLLLGPTLGFLMFSNAEFADRYSLLPTVMLYIAAGLLLGRCRLRHYRKLVLAAALFYLIGLGAMCRFYLPVWSNDVMFFRWAIETPNPSPNTLYRIANYLYTANDFESYLTVLNHPHIRHERRSRFLVRFSEAMIAYRRDGSTAILLEFDRPKVRDDLKNLNYRAGVELYVTLAEAALRNRDRAGAIRCYSELADLYRDDKFISAFYRGMIARLRGDLPAAIAAWEAALHWSPEDEATRRNLEQARSMQKR